MYVKTYLNKDQKFPKRYFIHFAWPVAFLLLEAVILSSDKVLLADMYYIGFSDPKLRILILLQAVVSIIYSLSIYRILAYYRSKAAHFLSNLSSLKLYQMHLVNTVLLFFFLLTVVTLTFFYNSFHPMQFSLYTNISFLVGSIIFFLVGAIALKPIVSITEIEELENETIQAAKKRINADKKNINGYQEKIEKALLGKKLFLNPELKLSDLSEELRLPSYLVSYAINQIYKKSFNDLVNDYRIAEFQSLAQKEENENITILALSLESGFNSKSNFNTQFKKRVHKTPKAFRDSLGP